MKLKFYKLDSDAVIPQFETKHAVGMDLTIIGFRSWNTLTSIELGKNDTVLAQTGLVAKLSDINYYLEIHMRSSTCKKYPGLVLANGTGIIDPDYCGPKDEILIALMNTSDRNYTIQKGDRLAQMIIRPRINLIIEESLDESKFFLPDRRSRGGFGSTG